MDELTSVVTSDVLGCSMDADQPLKLSTDIAGADPTIHVDEMVLPSELVDDRQHLHPTSPDSAVVNEVPGPHMSSMCRLRWQACARSSSTPLWFALWNPQAHLAPKPLHHSLADLPSLILKESGDLRISPLAVFARDTSHRRPQPHHPRVRLTGFVAHG